MRNGGGGGGGGGGDDVSTVAVPLVDLEPLVAVIVYEPEALFPSVNVVEARPSLPVVVLVVPNDALLSPEVMLNVTVFPDAALPSSCTSTVNGNVSPGAPDPGPLTTLIDNSGGGGGGGGGGGDVSTVAELLTEPLPTVAVTV